jgi:hypothetical protein
MNNYIEEFREYIIIKAGELAKIDSQSAANKPSPGKWSAKEIMGHLIDSASNNHKRFVEAALKDDLIFSGYQQDGWVSIQNYQTSSWMNLVELWKLFNLHIAYLMMNIPGEIKRRETTKHNLYNTAWQPVPEGEPASLDYFMRDYIGHLKHHINQISI